MGLINRAKNMILSPRAEWEVVEAEPTPPARVVTGYILPLAAAAAIANFIAVALVASGLGASFGVRPSMLGALVGVVVGLVMAVVAVFVLAFIVDALAPTFGGQKNMSQAVKVVAYSYTPAWVFGLLVVIPILGWIAALLGALYGIYLLYLGLPRLMKSAPEKSVPYLIVTIVCAIVLWVVLGLATAAISALFAPSLAMRGNPADVTFDKDSPMGKLDSFSKKMEEANRNMEAAQKSGDPAKQMEAAMGAMGTALSGGKGVDPVQLDALKPFAPEKFAGLPRTSQSADRSGVPGLMAARVDTEYGNDSGKRVQLEIVDTGGAAGLMGMAAWAMAGGSEQEDDDYRKRMRREGSRLVQEEVAKRGGPNKYSVVLGQRFMVSAEGEGVDIATLKSAVGSLDLGKLEALK